MILLTASSSAEWSEPVTYEEARAAIAEFVLDRGRYRTGDTWGRWLGEKKLLTRLDAKFRRMPIGTVVQVQRQSDREFLEVQKVSD